EFAYHLAGMRVAAALKTKAWLDDAEDHFKDAIKLSVDERKLIYYEGKEAASYFMGAAYLEAREFPKARDKFSEVLNMKREGKWNEKADKGWKRVDKIVRAMGGITLGDVGKEIAMRESVNRGDMAALFADELKIDKLFAGRIPVKSEIDKLKAEFTPADVLSHHFKEEVLTMMKWGIRGLEPQYDQTTKAYLFRPDNGVTRKELALVLEDVLVKLTGDEKIATAYFGQERSPFPDVPATAPWYNAVMNMTTRGLMESELSGEFRVNDLVDGAEAILAIRILRQRMNIY
ncbi:MAG: S-layer homology domain-containing protein, partial [Deltaproteobacteria bacterium]|nr:S-layer homology domain-containing protein [Deltaproteobacteria bacterium]